jgi:cyclic dehypoxanthinyl futalosine synthase
MGLHAGANDLGSVMIEEQVVASAESHHKKNPEGIQNIIRNAGFTPVSSTI